MQVLNVSESLSIGMFRMLSAILWIGNLQFSDSESEACQLTRQDGEVIKKIAALLGITEAQVRKCCTVRQISVKGTTTDIALKYHEVYSVTSDSIACKVYTGLHPCRPGRIVMPCPKRSTPERSPGWSTRSISAPTPEQTTQDL